MMNLLGCIEMITQKHLINHIQYPQKKPSYINLAFILITYVAGLFPCFDK